MDALLFRTRAAVLRFAVAIATSASLFLYVFMPEAAKELRAGEMEGEALSDGLTHFDAAVGTLPVAMAVVGLPASDRANPYVRLDVAGLAFGLFGIFGVISRHWAGASTCMSRQLQLQAPAHS